MKQKYILLTIILFVFLFLFSTPSLALISGDFGSANNGPPDGIVDFEDLMIFALAYGSIPTDVNWNPDCDIAGLDSTTPDGVIDFEDLMIFALHYGEIEIIIPDTTKIADEETELQLTFVSQDQSEITFVQSTPQLEELQEGDILFIGVTDQTPYGLLRKVTTITRGSKVDDTLTVSTEFTSIEEAVEELHVSVDIVLTQDDIDYEKLRLPPGISMSQDRGGFEYDHTFNLSDVSPIYVGDPSTTIDDVTIDGEIYLNYEMIFNLDIGWFNLGVEFRNIVESYTDLNVTVGGSLSLSDLLDPNPIHLFTIPFIPIPVAPLLVITPVIYINIGLDGEIHAELTVGVTIDQTGDNRLESGFEYNKGQWHSIKNSPVFDLEPKIPVLNLGGTIKPYVGPQLELIFNGCAGVYGSLYGYLELQADINDDPWWCLYGGFEGIIGAQLKILSFDLGDPVEWTIFNPDSKLLCCADGPFGDINHAPEITSDPVTSATKDQPYSYDVNATDPDVGDTLTYSLITKPTEMAINSSTGLITWTPTEDQVGENEVEVEVSDGDLFDTQSYTITVGGSTKTFTITASAGPNGSISPSGDVIVNEGLDQSFTITPDTGYQIDDVLVDENSVGTVSSYTFTNVIQNHSISATFSLSTAPGAVHNLTKDTYYTTIQAALDDADNNNTIEVSDGTYDESITFPSGKRIILQSVNGDSSTIIRGNNGSKTVTLINSPDGTTLEGFTITHESGNSGIGIYIYSGYLSINNSTISHNNHNDSIYIEGCGIYNAGTGTLTITNSTISDNAAGANIGGIQSTGPLTITNSIVSNNTSDSGVGGITSIDTSTIADSTISGNTGASVGGILINGTSSITNSTISDNIAINCFDNAAGIFNAGALTITNSTISNNSGGSRSGGIYSSLNTQLIITGSTISNNTSCGAGGGIFNSGALTITNSTISDNSGTSDHACGIFLQASSGPNIIGGNNENDFSNFNEFINNYKIGDAPSADQHIRDSDGDCHMDYPYNYFTTGNNGTYALRDIGPAGGYIFYDKGTYSDGWRYLETAPASTEWMDKQWGSYRTLIGGTSSDIGTGQSNTITIVTWLNANSDDTYGDVTDKTDRAAYLCYDLVYGGYSDWFLPSKDELNLMHTNLKVFGVGGFTNNRIWSSSEYSSNYAWYQIFSNGIQTHGFVKLDTYRVRAIRAF